MTLEQKSTTPIALQNSKLFLPESYVPKQALLLNESPSGILYKIGSNELGSFFQIKATSPDSLNIILLNRAFRKLNLKEHPQNISLLPILGSLEEKKEHIYEPSHIAPLHRVSQELVKAHWMLINPILKSEKGRQIIEPKCFLEVELEKKQDIGEGIADAIGITKTGNFIIMEHTSAPAPSSNGSALKYRQVERHTKLFLEKYGMDLSVRPVCIFYQQIDDKTMFLKIGHANQSV